MPTCLRREWGDSKSSRNDEEKMLSPSVYMCVHTPRVSWLLLGVRQNTVFLISTQNSHFSPHFCIAERHELA